jgi:hypothetical protein
VGVFELVALDLHGAIIRLLLYVLMGIGKLMD